MTVTMKDMMGIILYKNNLKLGKISLLSKLVYSIYIISHR